MAVILGRRNKLRFEGGGVVAYELADAIGPNPRPHDTPFFTTTTGRDSVMASALKPAQKEVLKALLRLWNAHLTGVAAFSREVVVRFPSDEVAFGSCVYVGTTVLESLGLATRATSLQRVGEYWGVTYTAPAAQAYRARSGLLTRNMDNVFNGRLARAS